MSSPSETKFLDADFHVSTYMIRIQSKDSVNLADFFNYTDFAKNRHMASICHRKFLEADLHHFTHLIIIETNDNVNLGD